MDFELELTLPIPSGATIKIINFPFYYNSLDDLILTCIENCGDSPFAKEDHFSGFPTIDLANFITSDLPANSIVKFTISGITLKNLATR